MNDLISVAAVAQNGAPCRCRAVCAKDLFFANNVKKWCGIEKGAEIADDNMVKLALTECVKGMRRLADLDIKLSQTYTWVRSCHDSYLEQFNDYFAFYFFSAQVPCEYVPQFDPTSRSAAIPQQMHHRRDAVSRKNVCTVSQVPSMVIGT